MKKVIIFISILLFVACGGGGDGSMPQTAPVITNILLYNTENLYEPATSFQIGEYVYFLIYATDPDLDMTTLYVTEYYPSDSDTIYQGPVPIVLPDQSASSVIYANIGPSRIVPPAGFYRAEFQIEDIQGNESNIFIIYIRILESE